MTKIVTPDRREHELTELDFEVEEEPWLRVKVSDGTVIKIRMTIMGVARSDQFYPDGKPMYFVNNPIQMRVTNVSQKLCKKQSKPLKKNDVAGYA
jgi:hypothetical protein